MCVDGQVATVTECKSRYFSPSYSLLSLSFNSYVTIFRPTTRQKPSPLNTIELQKRASRFFKMGSEETMKVKLFIH